MSGAGGGVAFDARQHGGGLSHDRQPLRIEADDIQHTASQKEQAAPGRAPDEAGRVQHLLPLAGRDDQGIHLRLAVVIGVGRSADGEEHGLAARHGSWPPVAALAPVARW